MASILTDEILGETGVDDIELVVAAAKAHRSAHWMDAMDGDPEGICH